MPDFAPNYTARYRVRYFAMGKAHSVTFRLQAGEDDPAALVTKIGLMLGDLAPNLSEDWGVLSASFALADSDVFLPAAAPTSPDGGQVVGAAQLAAAAVPICFSCRSIAGGKGKFFLYGTTWAITMLTATNLDWRILSSEAATISAAIVRLNETSPALVCNDNQNAVFYENVTVKPNDAWVRKMRRG